MRGVILCLLIVLQGSATAQQSLHAEVNRLGESFRQGQYDTIITEATDVMNRMGRLDSSLLYLRGYADSDLASLGDFCLNEKWPLASTLVQKIAKLRSLCPPKVQAIRLAGQVAFRVYSDDDAPWTQAILKLLPDAFHKGQEMFDTRVYETAVFIFKDAERYTAFYRTIYDSSPGSWVWASGENGILFFCETDPKGNQPAKDVDSDYFRSTIPHEYTHALIARTLGTVHLPSWLNEGIAQVVGSEAAPKLLDQNDQDIQQCVVNDTLLPLEKLSTWDSFKGAVEQQILLQHAASPSAHVSDAYAQGFHMTRYLLSLVGRRRFCDFLDMLARTHSVDNSFQSVFGFSIPEFYNAWLEDVHKKFGEGSP